MLSNKEDVVRGENSQGKGPPGVEMCQYGTTGNKVGTTSSLILPEHDWQGGVVGGTGQVGSRIMESFMGHAQTALLSQVKEKQQGTH